MLDIFKKRPVLFKFVGGGLYALKAEARDSAEFLCGILSEEDVCRFERRVDSIMAEKKALVEEKKRCLLVLYENRNALFGKRVKERETAERRLIELKTQLQMQTELIKELNHDLFCKLQQAPTDARQNCRK